ncbi:extracellular solute-binding protein [Clostridium butyricum]|uniref:extracellular solute-binding protein n=1 Tax=Clostridium butyricum TaxID=1492 RepID=UPI0013D28ED5|nr:extracellular solute-binding protein [Clostridium butyricum]MCQ2017192.1 extracellular solute-binding protein [Clostridium butyricum]MCQ2021071.1 extracellular solute-binding protein [Clostridium butyricum]NFB72807.1 extracellular solute-binding protein [Clostridium butyricum]NFB91048.1 extracellular solute-binding protein [Clostridium butyricum]UTY53665.1 extracellular solute-binding protein [Clostridium butyricum]
MKKVITMLLIVIYFCQGLLGCFEYSEVQNNNSDRDNQYEEACITPFGKYPETITYTLGKIIGANNSNMPGGDTYENNAYTRYLKEKINVQNKDSFEAQDINYNNMVAMAISEENIPDIMFVDNYDYLKLLVEKDMIEDLTDVYEKCASDRIKDIYKSYGEGIFESSTFNGKLMALPETSIDSGPNMIWLRKDWMDKLGLDAPKTLDDVEKIIDEFITKDPGGNGPGNTIGLACAPEVTSDNGYSYMFQTDIIFSKYNAYPKQWIKDENGNIVYGSVTNNAKNALSYMSKLYNKGILDNKFLVRTQSNIQDMIINGKCGSFFSLWWAPNNPLMDSIKNDKGADWEPYMIPTDEDGSTSFCIQNPNKKYVVVRKGYEHPEVVMKISSVLFDYFNSNNDSAQEIKQYYRDNVDPTARPLGINIDYKDAVIKSYRNINSVLNGEMDSNSLQLIEYSYYEQVKRYLNDPQNATPQDWAAYTSRMDAGGLLDRSKVKIIKTYFYNKETETMSKLWWKLEDLEKQAYLKIITGEEPIDYFDDFVDRWYKEGGRKITDEVQNEINKNTEKIK